MKPVNTTNKGFTLIELTVVIVIIMLVGGLVGPLTFKELEKSRAKTEYLKLRNTIKNHTTKAFTQGVSYRIEIDGTRLTAFSQLGERSWTFERLDMQKRFFIINGNGYPSIDKFEVKVAGLSRQITLQDMLGVKQDTIYANAQ